MRRSATDLGSGIDSPKLRPEDFDGDYILLTMEAAQDATWQGDKVVVLRFVETDKVLWLNYTMLKTLIAAFGADDAAWTGKQVPVVKYNAEYNGVTHFKCGIPKLDEWGELGVKVAPAAVASDSSKPAATLKGKTRKGSK